MVSTVVEVKEGPLTVIVMVFVSVAYTSIVWTIGVSQEESSTAALEPAAWKAAAAVIEAAATATGLAGAAGNTDCVTGQTVVYATIVCVTTIGDWRDAGQ